MFQMDRALAMFVFLFCHRVQVSLHPRLLLFRCQFLRFRFGPGWQEVSDLKSFLAVRLREVESDFGMLDFGSCLLCLPCFDICRRL